MSLTADDPSADVLDVGCGGLTAGSSVATTAPIEIFAVDSCEAVGAVAVSGTGAGVENSGLGDCCDVGNREEVVDVELEIPVNEAPKMPPGVPVEGTEDVCCPKTPVD